MLLEFEHGGRDEFGLASGHRGDALAFVNGFGESFLKTFLELGFVVEEIELGRRAAHKEEDDTLGGGLRETESVRAGFRMRSEVSEDRGTKAHARGVEELAAGLWIEHSEQKKESGPRFNYSLDVFCSYSLLLRVADLEHSVEDGVPGLVFL